MSDVGKTVKFGMDVLVSDEALIPRSWSDSLWAGVLGPDNRTQAQKDASHEAWMQRRAESRTAIELAHASALAAADGAARAVLELHAPVFRGDFGDDAHCDGCDVDGYEAEQPAFPCRTYELVRDFGGTP